MPRLPRSGRDRARRHADAPVQMLDDVAQRTEAIRRDAAGGRLARVVGRDDDRADPARRGVTNTRHRAAHRTQGAVEGELAEAQDVDVAL